jgi:hypothetical protein
MRHLNKYYDLDDNFSQKHSKQTRVFSDLLSWKPFVEPQQWVVFATDLSYLLLWFWPFLQSFQPHWQPAFAVGLCLAKYLDGARQHSLRSPPPTAAVYCQALLLVQSALKSGSWGWGQKISHLWRDLWDKYLEAQLVCMGYDNEDHCKWLEVRREQLFPSHKIRPQGPWPWLIWQGQHKQGVTLKVQWTFFHD